MSELTPEEILESFIALSVILVLAAAFSEIYFDKNIIDLVTEAIKIIMYVCISFLVLVIIRNVIDEI